ncbi:MAG: cysteine desulfurase [Gemmatimonadales bacterium]|nr:cysteine desulfurase [Gemmatimonadales bacterium]
MSHTNNSLTHRLKDGALRRDFPIFRTNSRDNGLIYLDSGASAQKPHSVLTSIQDFYDSAYANIHRGVYQLSEEATLRYEGGRERVRRFLNARRVEEIVFVRGTTEAINLLASTFGRSKVGPGDEILITHMEHHSNIVPWQMLCQSTGAHLVVVPITDDGALDLEEFERLLGPRTKLVSVAHVSNALGTINPVKEIVRLAHDKGVPVVIDGAQAVPHLPVDVQDLDCDFYVFSGHKIYGPTGIGALYGKAGHLAAMPPYQGGGDMIESVTFDKTTYAPVPARFEAGTPNIAGVVGLTAALDYVDAVGFEAIQEHGEDLLEHGTRLLEEIPGLRIVGTAARKVPVFSFVLDDIHPHDVGTFLAGANVAVRAGHHCAQPVMERFGVPATTRASLGIYNTREDLQALVDAILQLRRFFGK